MAELILLPALSPTMKTGTITRWVVEEGQAVKAGDVLAEIETDKAVMEFESVEEGVLLKILVPAGGEEMDVNTPIGIIGEAGEDISSLETSSPSPKVASSAAPLPASNVSHEDHNVGNTAPATAGDEEFAGMKMQPITVRNAIRDAMAEEMRRDKDVFLLGEEVAEYQGAYKCSQNLLEEFGANRVIDMPITEHGFAGMAVGACYTGLRPIVEFMTFNFSMQAIDHIINSAAKTRYMSGGQVSCPIVFRGPNGAAARVGAQHSQCYASWYAHVPGLKVLMPWSAADAKGLLKAAIRDPNPVVFLENEILYGQTFDCPEDEDFVIEIGKAKIEKAGTDVTLVAYGITVGQALEAAKILEGKGISAEVINLRSLRPLDKHSIVESVKKTGRILTVEEGWGLAGIGSEISSIAVEEAFDYLDAPPARVYGRDVPMPYAENLEKLALPTVDWIVDAADELMRGAQ